MHRLIILVFFFLAPMKLFAGQTAIIGVTTIDPGTGAVHEAQTVLIDGGRVVTIGNRDDLAAPDDAELINGAGRYLIPGLTDMHVHLEHFASSDVLTTFLSRGVTTVRQLDGRPRILEWRAAVREGSLLGPEIITAGPVIDGEPPSEADYMVATDNESAVRAVALQQNAGYDLIKIYHGLNAHAFGAVMREASRRGMPVTGHVPWQVGIEAAIGQGLRCIEHLDGFDDLVADARVEQPEPWHWRRRIFAYAVREDKVNESAAWIAGMGVWNVPTLTVHDWRWLHPDTRHELEARPSMALVPDDMVERWRPENWSGEQALLYSRLGEEDYDWIRIGFRQAKSVVHSLHEAGARILVGTDTPNPYIVPGESVHDELFNLVSAGLTPIEALAAATSSPAEYLERQKSGCIRVGCQADLVMLDDNPLSDINATRGIAGIVIDGRWYAAATLDRMTHCNWATPEDCSETAD